MLKEEEVRERLVNRRVLIIEDDESLSKRLVNEFKRYRAEVLVKYYVDSGLEELKKNGSNYQLIVVDVMLPQTKEEFQQIQRCRKEVDECVKILMQEDEAPPDDDEFGKRLEKAREQRKSLLNKIASLIRKLGGIEMVKDWLNWLTKNQDDEDEKIERPPILYLTAVGNEDAIDEGKKAAEDKDVEWLVKPVTGLRLLHAAGELIK